MFFEGFRKFFKCGGLKGTKKALIILKACPNDLTRLLVLKDYWPCEATRHKMEIETSTIEKIRKTKRNH